MEDRKSHSIEGPPIARAIRRAHLSCYYDEFSREYHSIDRLLSERRVETSPVKGWSGPISAYLKDYERRVRESDVFVGIYGSFYGGMVPNIENRNEMHISYLEWDYRIAEEEGIPILPFVQNVQYREERLEDLLRRVVTRKRTYSFKGEKDLIRGIVHCLDDLEDIGGRLPRERQGIRVVEARALHPDPQFILSNVFVLESEKASIQGTCFNLEGNGLVTCAHVLQPDLVLFHPDRMGETYQVEVVSSDSDVDIALIDAPGLKLGRGLPQSSADQLSIGSDILIAGYPNYRPGDSGIVDSGKVIGFRPVRSVRRILVGLPIVAGNSGGPVLDAGGRVVGLALTGADRMEDAHLTENHGVVPIDALRFLE